MYVFFSRDGFCRVGQACVELLTSDDPPTLAFQSAGITGVSYHVQAIIFYINFTYTLVRASFECANEKVAIGWSIKKMGFS